MIRILIALFFTIPLSAQRGDFYDTYDYNMKNYNGGESIEAGHYKEYQLPPKNEKPPLVSPKNVQKQPDYSSLLQGQVGIRRSNNQPQNPTTQTNNLPINPMTGQVNPDAILKQREKEKQSKEKKRQFLNRDIEPYIETRSRRMEVVFMTTLPFATVLSVGLTVLAGRVGNNGDFIKSSPGFAFAFLLTMGFSAANMISDINRYDEYMKNKHENHLGYNPIESKNNISKRNFINFSFELGSKNF